MNQIYLNRRYPLRRDLHALLQKHASLTADEAASLLPYAFSSIGRALRDLKESGYLDCWEEKAGNGSARKHYYIRGRDVRPFPKISGTSGSRPECVKRLFAEGM